MVDISLEASVVGFNRVLEGGGQLKILVSLNKLICDVHVGNAKVFAEEKAIQ